MRRFSTIVAALLLPGSAALANGFYVNDHGAAATGRGNAVVATSSDGSSIVHNVAGIAQGDGVNVQIGASVVAPNVSFTATGDEASTSTTQPPSVTPQLFVTARVHEALAVGIGVHSPFGSKIEWPASAPFADEVRLQQLRTVFITPSVAGNLNKWVPGLTVGAGLDLVPSDVKLQQDIFFGDQTGSATLGGKAFGVGGRVGVQYTPAALKAMSLGVQYRTPVKLDFDGQGDFDIAAPYRSQLPPDGDISTSITLPGQLSAGLAYRPMPRLEIEANALWTQWSKVKSIDITLPDGQVTVSPRDYVNRVTTRLGAAYRLPGAPVTVRLGYMYDPTPVPGTTLTAALPDKNRHDVTVGVGYKRGRYTVDLGSLVVLPGSRETSTTEGEPPTKGTFDISAVVVAATLGVALGK